MKRHILIIVLIGLFTETIDRTELRSGKGFRLHVCEFSQMRQCSGSCATIELILSLFLVVQWSTTAELYDQKMRTKSSQTQMRKQWWQLEWTTSRLDGNVRSELKLLWGMRFIDTMLNDRESRRNSSCTRERDKGTASLGCLPIGSRRTVVSPFHHHWDRFHRGTVSTDGEQEMLVRIVLAEGNSRQRRRYPREGNSSAGFRRVALLTGLADVEPIHRRKEMVPSSMNWQRDDRVSIVSCNQRLDECMTNNHQPVRTVPMQREASNDNTLRWTWPNQSIRHWCHIRRTGRIVDAEDLKRIDTSILHWCMREKCPTLIRRVAFWLRMRISTARLLTSFQFQFFVLLLLSFFFVSSVLASIGNDNPFTIDEMQIIDVRDEIDQ